MARFWTPFLAIFDDFDGLIECFVPKNGPFSEIRMIVPKFEGRNLLPPFARNKSRLPQQMSRKIGIDDLKEVKK